MEGVGGHTLAWEGVVVGVGAHLVRLGPGLGMAVVEEEEEEEE